MKLGAVLGGVVEGFNKQRAENQAAAENEYKLQQEALQQQAQQDMAKLAQTGPKVGDPVGVADNAALPSITNEEFNQHYGSGEPTPDFNGPQAPNEATWRASIAKAYNQRISAGVDHEQVNAPPDQQAAPPAAQDVSQLGAPAGVQQPTAGVTTYSRLASDPPVHLERNPPAGIPTQGQDAYGQPAAQSVNPFKLIDTWTLSPHAEGTGFVQNDADGGAARYGIDSRYNPGMTADVLKNMTRPQAVDWLVAHQWVPAMAAAKEITHGQPLSAAMQAVYFDSYMMNPTKAKQWLAASNGDVNTFMNSRENFQHYLATSSDINPQTKQPYKDQYGKYEHAWTTRSAALRQFVGVDGQPAAADSQSAQDQQNAAPVRVYLPGYGPAQVSNTQTLSGPGSHPVLFADDPSDYVSYKSPDGQTRLTTQPRTYTQDDADQAMLGILMRNGQYDAAQNLQDKILDRQSKRLAIQQQQLETQRNQLIQTVSQAPDDPHVLASLHNTLHGNGKYGAIDVDPRTGAVTALIYDNDTRQLIGQQTFAGQRNSDGSWALSPGQQMKMEMLKSLGPNYVTDTLNELRTTGEFRSNAAAARANNATADRTEQENAAGLPAAEVAHTQAETNAANAGAEASRAGAGLATAQAAATSQKSGQEQWTFDQQRNNYAVLADPHSTPERRSYAASNMAALSGITGLKPLQEQLNVNGVPMSQAQAPNGTVFVFEPTQGKYLPTTGKYAVSVTAIQNDPDYKAGNITADTNAAGQTLWYVTMPGSSRRGYPSVQDAKAEVRALQLRQQQSGQSNPLAPGQPLGAPGQPTLGQDQGGPAPGWPALGARAVGR